MDIRDRIQEEAFQTWEEEGRKGIIKSAPRTGKCRIAAKAILDYTHIVIILPRNDIIDGWEDTFGQLWGERSPSRIDYVTTRGIKKLGIGSKNTLYVYDELHEYSQQQLSDLEAITTNPDIHVMGLTGTLTKTKGDRILKTLGLPVNYDYSIEEAVRDGILTDYEINIHKVPLDNKIRSHKYRKGFITEKSYFDKINYSLSKSKGVTKSFLSNKLIQVLQTSLSKKDQALKLLELYRGQRVLVFCGQTKIADSLGIEVYHSKAKEKSILTSFCKDEGVTQLATVKMLQAGITIKPIDRGILQYTSGSPEDCAQKICRFLAFEWNKKATIDIICADEPFELSRIRTALMYFDTSKINYI